MNVLFIINYFGLHGSSKSALALINSLKKEGLQAYIMGENGELEDEFRRITNGLFLVQKSKYHRPTFTSLLLIRKLVKLWNINLIVGIGRFKALAGQLSCMLFLNKHPINILNISRVFHWVKHPKWHIPDIGYSTVLSGYHKDMIISNYNFTPENIYTFSGRFDIPEALPQKSGSVKKELQVLIVRRLDHPKYKCVTGVLEQLCSWDIFGNWSVSVAGGGNAEKIVLDKVKEIKKGYPDSDIRVLGKRTDVNELMKGADIVIGSERVAVEGMALGCIVLLANDEGLIDVITPENIGKFNHDNYLGIAYDSISIKDIKKKLLSILSERTKRSEILDSNFKYIKNNLDIHLGTGVFLKIIHNAVENPLTYIDRIKGLGKIIKAWLILEKYSLTDRLLQRFGKINKNSN